MARNPCGENKGDLLCALDPNHAGMHAGWSGVERRMVSWENVRSPITDRAEAMSTTKRMAMEIDGRAQILQALQAAKGEWVGGDFFISELGIIRGMDLVKRLRRDGYPIAIRLRPDGGGAWEYRFGEDSR